MARSTELHACMGKAGGRAGATQVGRLQAPLPPHPAEGHLPSGVKGCPPRLSRQACPLNPTTEVTPTAGSRPQRYLQNKKQGPSFQEPPACHPLAPAPLINIQQLRQSLTEAQSWPLSQEPAAGAGGQAGPVQTQQKWPLAWLSHLLGVTPGTGPDSMVTAVPQKLPPDPGGTVNPAERQQDRPWVPRERAGCSPQGP